MDFPKYKPPNKLKTKLLFCQLIFYLRFKILRGFIISLRITELTQHIGSYVNFPLKRENGVGDGDRAFQSYKLPMHHH